MQHDLETQMAAEKEWLDRWKTGPQRTRWKQLPPQAGDRAPDFELPDSTGADLKISTLWNAKPLLLVFWRQYGCGCGVQRAERLRNEYPMYADANVAVIGQGEPERAAAYAAKYELPRVPILCDPDFKAYEAYGLLEGKESQLLFDAPLSMQDRDLQAGLDFCTERKAAGRPPVDNPWLLPGEFVIDSRGVLRLAYRYNYCEDYPDPRVLVASIREATMSPT